jgi:hypothetical protein
MKRAQRRFHAGIWPIIGVLMIATLALAFVVREHPVPKNTTPAQGAR